MISHLCDNCGEPDARSCPIGSQYGDSIIMADFCTQCYEAIIGGEFDVFALRNPAKFGLAVTERMNALPGEES